MRNYETKIEVRGLRRADPARAREPIGIGEVIALPDLVARDLLRHVAIVETKASPTVELTFDSLKPVAKIAGIAPEDRGALAAAILDLGGVVLFPEDDGSVDLSLLSGPALVEGVLALVEDHIIEPTDLSRKLSDELILAEVAFRLQVGTLNADAVRALLPVDEPPADPPVDPEMLAKPAVSRKKA